MATPAWPRHAARAAGWLVLGAGVTVGLAGTAALWSPLGEETRLAPADERDAIRRRGLDAEDLGLWLTRRTGPGVRQDVVHGHYFGSDHLFGLGDRHLAAGWPWPCLEGTWRDTSPPAGAVAAPAWLHPRSEPTGPTTRVIPLRPRWGALVANAMLMTVVLFMLFRAPLAIRAAWRAGQGRCPACGYPSTGTGVCPECGAEGR